MSSEQEIYKSYNLPSWSPPSWAFGVVWPLLYVLMFISFGSLLWKNSQGQLGASSVLIIPIAINIVANLLYTYLQFGTSLKWLAALDIIIIIATLLYIIPTAIQNDEIAWAGWLNVPYLLWVSFAFILQMWINIHN